MKNCYNGSGIQREAYEEDDTTIATNSFVNEGKEKLSYHQGFYVNVNFFCFWIAHACRVTSVLSANL